MKKTGRPDNAQRSIKCPNCGNMIAISGQIMKCDICGEILNAKLDKTVVASNEDY